MAIVAGVDFKAHLLPEPSNHEPVTVTSRPRPVRTIKVGKGKVRAFVDVGFDVRNDSRSHGISLSYDGRDAPEMRWLQFIWREVVPDRGRPVAAGQIAWSDPAADVLHPALGEGDSYLDIQASDGDRPISVLLFSGRPLREPVAAGASFVMDTGDEIRHAVKDYESGKFGEISRTARL